MFQEYDMMNTLRIPYDYVSQEYYIYT